MPAPGFNRSTGTLLLNSTFGPQQWISVDASTQGTQFGRAVAVSSFGDVLAIGSNMSGGAVHIYSCLRGEACVVMSTITAESHSSPSDCFACALAMDGGAATLAVGVPGRGNGVVLLYSCTGAICTPTPVSVLRRFRIILSHSR